MATEGDASLPYHEPNIVTILVQSSFLLLLNIVNSLLDKALYCGLVGQVLLGVAWGTPGARWLGLEVERVVVQFGYLGLLLLVYEGGLSTSIRSLKSNLLLSSGVAVTGIALPIGLSFVLARLMDATPLQCFAAGAALCSTSLGTTFAVLSTSGLTKSRLGVVLTSAAMMDDVVGLVMVQVISNLGAKTTSINAVTVVRPLMVSVAFAVVVPLLCVPVARPLTTWLNARRIATPKGRLNQLFSSRKTAFTLQTLILIGCVTGSSYAGTSNLFAAYIAGAAISWWDSEVPHLPVARLLPREEEGSSPSGTGSVEFRERESTPLDTSSTSELHIKGSGMDIYGSYYATPVNRVLRPLFFASIGFLIPITKMFSGQIVWKGVVYTLLMILGKFACGAWLLSWRLPLLGKVKLLTVDLLRSGSKHSCGRSPQPQNATTSTTTARTNTSTPDEGPRNPVATSEQESQVSNGPPNSTPAPIETTITVPSRDSARVKPRSLYPAAIIGCAMTARGEIGFLISSIAESNGIFAGDSTSQSNSDIFLVVTWAIVLCTILGPLAVGLTVNRVKKLERGAVQDRRAIRWDVLGVWGVS